MPTFSRHKFDESQTFIVQVFYSKNKDFETLRLVIYIYISFLEVNWKVIDNPAHQGKYML
jgi:hypothetical protein